MAADLTKLEYDVLNVVALRKMVAAEAVAHLVGQTIREVESTMSLLTERGLIVLVGGQAFPDDGTEPALARVAAGLYADLRRDAELLALVDDFEAVNTRLLATMSAWQQVEVGGRSVANDHCDPRYDDRVITRVGRLVRRLDPLLEALSRYDPRFQGYRRRFDAALDGIDQGRHELVSSPVEDSVHTIWFEFHEDLLRTLGRARAE